MSIKFWPITQCVPHSLQDTVLTGVSVQDRVSASGNRWKVCSFCHTTMKARHENGSTNLIRYFSKTVGLVFYFNFTKATQIRSISWRRMRRSRFYGMSSWYWPTFLRLPCPRWLRIYCILYLLWFMSCCSFVTMISIDNPFYFRDKFRRKGILLLLIHFCWIVGFPWPVEFLRSTDIWKKKKKTSTQDQMCIARLVLNQSVWFDLDVILTELLFDLVVEHGCKHIIMASSL